jgi:DNA topoisomerase VI subunit B
MKELCVSQLQGSFTFPHRSCRRGMQSIGMSKAALFSSELNGTIIRVILTSSERGGKDHLILRLANKMLTFLIQIC